METVPSTDGVTLAVHDLGGDGPPLLLCHATGFHGRVWTALAGEFPEGTWLLLPHEMGVIDAAAAEIVPINRHFWER